jgi:hypothetical protein
MQPTDTFSNVVPCPPSHRTTLHSCGVSCSYHAWCHFSSPSSAGSCLAVQSSRPESHTPPTSSPRLFTRTRILTPVRQSYTQPQLQPQPHIYRRSSIAFPWQERKQISILSSTFASVLLAVRYVPTTQGITSKTHLYCRGGKSAFMLVLQLSSSLAPITLVRSFLSTWTCLSIGVLEAHSDSHVQEPPISADACFDKITAVMELDLSIRGLVVLWSRGIARPSGLHAQKHCFLDIGDSTLSTTDMLHVLRFVVPLVLV